MKKFFATALILLMLALSTANCFAATSSSNSEMSAQYVVTMLHVETFTISSGGMASMKGRLEPMDDTEVDQVKITLTLEDGAGTVVYNKTYDATWSNVSKSYSTTKNYQLGKAGRYTFRATYKCYKNGSLLETIKCDPLYKSF